MHTPKPINRGHLSCFRQLLHMQNIFSGKVHFVGSSHRAPPQHMSPKEMYTRFAFVAFYCAEIPIDWSHILQDDVQWASYQIRKIAGCACAGNAGNVFPRRRFQRKSLVNDPGMHHGTCVTHVPWCMSGSFTCGDGENVPGIPGACAPAILRIWQEAHGDRDSASEAILKVIGKLITRVTHDT